VSADPKSTNHPNRRKPYTPYYECYRLSKYRGYPCKVRRINAEVIERLFLQTVERLVWDRDLVAEATAHIGADDTGLKELAAQESEVRERLSEIEGKIGRIITAVEDGLAGSSVRARLQELENQQMLLKGELAEMRMRRKESETEPIDIDEAMGLFGRFAKLFERATSEEKEALADAVLKSATVDEDKVVEFEFYVGSDPGYVVQNVKFGSPEGIRIICILGPVPVPLRVAGWAVGGLLRSGPVRCATATAGMIERSLGLLVSFSPPASPELALRRRT